MSTVELRAIELAERYFRSQGYEVQNVSKGKQRGQHSGYDFVITKNGHSEKVEVKGSKNQWGIPDPYHTEFDENRRLVADFLCVVHVAGEPPTLCLIPRDDIPPECIKPRRGHRIGGGFQKEAFMGKHKKEIPLAE